MPFYVNYKLTWHAKTPVAVSHAAADPVSAGVQGTEVHQLGAGGSCEPCCAATSKPQGAGALGVACPVIVTGAGGTRVHLLLTCSTLVTCERAEREQISLICWKERLKAYSCAITGKLLVLKGKLWDSDEPAFNSG